MYGEHYHRWRESLSTADLLQRDAESLIESARAKVREARRLLDTAREIREGDVHIVAPW